MTSPAHVHGDPDVNDLWERTGECLTRLARIEEVHGQRFDRIEQRLDRVEERLDRVGELLREILARLPRKDA